VEGMCIVISIGKSLVQTLTNKIYVMIFAQVSPFLLPKYKSNVLVVPSERLIVQ